MANKKEFGSLPESLELSKCEFVVKLEERWSRHNTLVCVGLDSDEEKIPRGESIERFNQQIVDQTHDLVCAYKPNTAFYEARGFAGWLTLEETINYIKENYPEIPVILDAKRADIGNTNLGYTRMAFDRMGADAITVNPYLGSTFFDGKEIKLEALQPFLEWKNKGIIVLAKTSNKSGGEIQDLPINLRQLTTYSDKFGRMDELREKIGSDIVPLWSIVAYRVAKYWNVNGNCGLVVGATYPEELGLARKIVGDKIPILVPGAGKKRGQGGDVEAAVKAGIDSRKQGIIINSSREIIFASSDPTDFAQAARKATQELKEEINQFRQ